MKPKVNHTSFMFFCVLDHFGKREKCPKTLFIALITLMAIHFRRQTSSVSWKKRLPASWHADFPLSQWGRSECGKHVFPSGQRAKGGCLHFAHIRSQWLSTDSSIISQTVGQSFMLLLTTQKTDTSLHRWGCPDFFWLHSNFLGILGCTPISGSFASEQMNPWLARSRSVC